MRVRTHVIVVVGFAAHLHAQTAVATGHYDNFRTGANTNETILTPANVNSSQFGELARLAVDGCIFAQPLYVPQVPTPNRGLRNLVFIATSTNAIYAYDADGYELQWRANFGRPFPSRVVARDYYAFLNCRADPAYAGQWRIGITCTPAIDTEAGAMY